MFRRYVLLTCIGCACVASLKTQVREPQADVPDALRPDAPELGFGVSGPEGDGPEGVGHMMALAVSAARHASGTHFGCGSFGDGACNDDMAVPGRASLIQMAEAELETKQASKSEATSESTLNQTAQGTLEATSESTLNQTAQSTLEAASESALETEMLSMELDGPGGDLKFRETLNQPGDPSAMSHQGRMDHVWHHDMWPGHHNTARKNGDEGFNFFTSAPVEDWIVLLCVSIFLCLLDWFVFRHAPETFKWHLALIGIWIFFAFLYNMYILKRQGGAKAFEWCTGYLLEWMLSMDNLFVFHLIFSTYSTPYNQIHKAVFVGIIGAVFMRMLFFMVVSTLLHVFGWFRWPFGCLLVWSGIEAAKSDDDDDMDPEDTRLMKALNWCLGSRLSPKYDEKHQGCFIVDVDGRYKATILLVVICCLEFTDILFALDSVSAKIAQIPDQYIAFSSSVIAMFGLRAMFFIIKDLVDMFDVLKYGLCLILVFIGVELMFSHWLKLASSTVCIMIVSVFAVCIAASHAKKKYFPAPPSDDEEEDEAAEKGKGGDLDKLGDKIKKADVPAVEAPAPEPAIGKPQKIS